MWNTGIRQLTGKGYMQSASAYPGLRAAGLQVFFPATSHLRNAPGCTPWTTPGRRAIHGKETAPWLVRRGEEIHKDLVLLNSDDVCSCPSGSNPLLPESKSRQLKCTLFSAPSSQHNRSLGAGPSALLLDQGQAPSGPPTSYGPSLG